MFFYPAVWQYGKFKLKFVWTIPDIPADSPDMRTMLLYILPLLMLAGCRAKTEKPAENTQTQIPVPQVDKAVNDFMTKHDVPGLSLAITKKGKLVYAKGYGFADKAAATMVDRNSLFRIASVSKPVTAIAIMKLVEDGKVALDDRVFGPGAILDTIYGTKPYAAALKNITLKQLLQHTCGGWQNDGNDPMFTNTGMTQAELISWTLDNRPLGYTPGTNYAYSNFGYCIIGRIIEKLTGKGYEQWVKENILAPAGITGMVISGNTFADRKLHEVTYYGQNGENPYIYNISRMDAHGGWLASATDLARLMVKVDGFSSNPDILSASSISTMTGGSAANPGYACGWLVNSAGNWWHNGSLPGTATEIVRTSGEYCWVILCNTRTNAPNFMEDLDGLVWIPVTDNTTVWPEADQF
jgi:D-alanyl-D-alanine carboxypeptidase